MRLDRGIGEIGTTDQPYGPEVPPPLAEILKQPLGAAIEAKYAQEQDRSGLDRRGGPLTNIWSGSVRGSSITTMVADLIERRRSRHRSHRGRLQQCRQAVILVLSVAIVSAPLFTSTIWWCDRVSAPYTARVVAGARACDYFSLSVEPRNSLRPSASRRLRPTPLLAPSLA